MAWTLLAKAATMALTYDARLVPRDTLEITSRGLERHICEAVAWLLGGELDEQAMKRLALPGALGGCGLRMDGVGLAADAAFWSTWAMTKKVAPGIASEAGLGEVPAADGQAAAAARARLAEAGVEVDADGRVTFSQTQRDVYAASPWSQDLPVTGNTLKIGPSAEDNEELAVTGLPRKFASRIHRHVEALAAAEIWQSAGDETRRIMLSAGSKGAGSDWIAVPTSWHEWWNGAEFVTAAFEVGFIEDACEHPLSPHDEVYRRAVRTTYAWSRNPPPGLTVWPSAPEGAHGDEEIAGCRTEAHAFRDRR